MKLICIGDSLTYGYGVSSSQRWTKLTAQLCGIEVENFGVNGDTTGGMLARLPDILKRADIASSIVMITGGGNDIFFSGREDVARANIAAMTQQVLAVGAFPIVGIMMPVSADFCPELWGAVVDFKASESKVNSYREWLKKYCGAFGISAIDFGELVDSSMLIDGLHPDARGHRIIAGAVAELIKETEEK